VTPRPKSQYPKANLIALRVSDDMLADMRAIQERDGIPLSEQARRGIREWLALKGVTKSERKRVAARKRP
jgi:hypothetical protein